MKNYVMFVRTDHSSFIRIINSGHCLRAQTKFQLFNLRRWNKWRGIRHVATFSFSLLCFPNLRSFWSILTAFNSQYLIFCGMRPRISILYLHISFKPLMIIPDNWRIWRGSSFWQNIIKYRRSLLSEEELNSYWRLWTSSLLWCLRRHLWPTWPCLPRRDLLY